MAQVLDDDRVVGLLLVQGEAFSTQLGGAFWWRRWSAWRPGAHLWLNLPGLGIEFTDTLVDPEDLDHELDDWDAEQFGLVGRTYALRWLDDQTSRRLAQSEFGIDNT